MRRTLFVVLMAAWSAGVMTGNRITAARADCAKAAPVPAGWALVLAQESTFDDRATTFRCTVLQADPPLPREVEFLTPGGRQPDGALVEVESIRPDGRHGRTCLLLPDDYCLVQYVVEGEELRPVARWTVWIPGEFQAHSPETLESLEGWRAAEFQRRLDTRAFDDLLVYEDSVNRSGPRRVVGAPPEEAITFGAWKRQQHEDGAPGDDEAGDGEN